LGASALFCREEARIRTDFALVTVVPLEFIYLWHQVERHLGTFHKGRALLDRAAPQSEFGVATCQGFFAVVTRLKVGFAAEAALFEFGSGFGRSHLVSRRSSGNPVKDSLSGIVWFLHGFVLQPREARGL